MKKILLSAALIIFTASTVLLFAQSTIDIKKPAYIKADVLNIRNIPSSSGEKVGSFSQGDKVKLSKKSDKTEKVGDKTDYWYFASGGGKSGWIFGAFLTNDEKSAKPINYNGVYYYKNIKEPKEKITSILTISGTVYVLKEYDYDGSTTEMRGSATIENDSIKLEPETKLYTASDDDLRQYGLDYRNSGTVVNIADVEEEKEYYRDTLIVLSCGSKTYIISKRKNDGGIPACNAVEYSYMK